MVTVFSLESRIKDRFKAQGEPGYEFIIDFQLDSERDLRLLKDLLNVFVDSNCYEVSTMAEKEDFVDVICKSDFRYGTEMINCIKIKTYAIKDKIEWSFHKKENHNFSDFDNDNNNIYFLTEEIKIKKDSFYTGYLIFPSTPIQI